MSARAATSRHVEATEVERTLDIEAIGAQGDGVAAEADFARVTLAGETLFQSRAPTVRLGPATVTLPAGGFLQAVPEAEVAMGDFIAEAATGAGRIADLYCGVGTFTFRLAQVAPVTAVDASVGAIQALAKAIGTAPGLKAITAEARDLDRRPLLVQDLKRIDVAVFDPPRAGAAIQTAELARSKVSRVIGVSCNPATFARDAAVLAQAGFRLERVLPVDQFLWSPHIELVGVFSRVRR